MRKLATIRKIDEINSIEGADSIEVATVGGWKVVVKRNEFNVGDLAVYLEIDSWVPHELAPFLSKGQEPREFNGVKGERLKTVKLRGQVSQGLLLPLESLFPLSSGLPVEGQDVTDIIGVQKWEMPVPARLAGEVRGPFPSQVPKTDQERVQNLVDELKTYNNTMFEVTEKLDGSSCTFFFDQYNDFHVCSRNLDLKETDNNSFWKVAVKYQVQEKLLELGINNIAIQGELIGEGIQGNKYKLKGQDFFVFDIYDVKQGKYLSNNERLSLTNKLGLKHTPVIQVSKIDTKVQDLLLMAEGKSILNSSTEREGLVFKSIDNPDIHFKAISNKFLLKNGE